MASIGESAKRRKIDNMDIFNGLFCAEGSYKRLGDPGTPGSRTTRVNKHQYHPMNVTKAR